MTTINTIQKDMSIEINNELELIIKQEIPHYRRITTLETRICNVPPVQQRSILLVHQILDATVTVAMNKSVFELTGETIIDCSGGLFKRTSMYRYYDSLEEIFVSAYNRELLALANLLDDYDKRYNRCTTNQQKIKVIGKHLGQLEMLIQSIRSNSKIKLNIDPLNIGDVL